MPATNDHIAAFAPALYAELSRIAGRAAWSPADKARALGELIRRLYAEAVKSEQLIFSTLFSRISYVGQVFQFPPELIGRAHHFRRRLTRIGSERPARESDVACGLRVLGESLALLSGLAPPDEVRALWEGRDDGYVPAHTGAQQAVQPAIRVLALRDLPDEQCLEVQDESYPEQVLRARYNLADRNENFNESIALLRRVFRFPVMLSLIDAARDGDYLLPRAIVIEPDYLIDISAIAECFKDSGVEPFSYLVKKFLPYAPTPPILLGNIANHFLDRLLHEPEAEFNTLFKETFGLYPLVYAGLSDAQVREIRQKAYGHYIRLRQMAREGFALQGIDPAHSSLEPSFYSSQYGIQGRLDLFCRNERGAHIVELKSGEPFRPNSYGIQRSHFTQTLLYDLLVRSVYGADTDPAKYILYSGVERSPLRFAPTVAPEQWEALQVRNRLLAIERLLMQIRPGMSEAPVIRRLCDLADKYTHGFMARDFTDFTQTYTRLAPLERKYLLAFAGFAAREHWLAKAGVENDEQTGGQAALWRRNLTDKERAFSILSGLEIAENYADRPDARIVFRKTAATNPLANFRVGDIVALYPAATSDQSVLDHQVIKGAIAYMDAERVEVQLRFRQSNLRHFETDGSIWRLEPDTMDAGFTGMYRSLFAWASALPDKRALLLNRPPAPPPNPCPPLPPDITQGMTDEQRELLGRMIASEEYFLLWGPPGTGKTSVMIRALAHWVLRCTSDKLLLLAYTNRAVDEICEALDAIGGDIRNHYLRIGSRHGAGERFRPQMLPEQLAGVDTRADLRRLLESRRIYVGTVASLAQNEALFQLLAFERLVVDEASQLLEPQIVGLLPRFRHFTLVGDHRQLPAVSAQNEFDTRVNDPDLRDIGLRDLRDSFFERLYRRCQAQGWTHAFGQLTMQGRMHQDIMEFPSRLFYDASLRILPHSERQIRPAPAYLDFGKKSEGDGQGEGIALGARRVAFIPVTDPDALPNAKTGRAEAEWVVRCIRMLRRCDPNASIGVITPWRAQIAQIRECLLAEGLNPDDYTVDTVERYQGGARDVILISCCIHSPLQMRQFVSLSSEDVDRKMNVALTRARERLILIGNPQALGSDARYAEFIRLYDISSCRPLPPSRTH